MHSTTRFGHWLNRAILGMLGLIFLLAGAGLLFLALRDSPVGNVGWFAVLAFAAAAAVVGLRQLYGALTGRFPRWFRDLYHLWN